jgi:hypothetical protein
MKLYTKEDHSVKMCILQRECSPLFLRSYGPWTLIFFLKSQNTLSSQLLQTPLR